MNAVQQWARRYGVPQEALVELGRLLQAAGPRRKPPRRPLRTEADVVDEARLQCSQRRWPVWRNNVGACVDDRGHFVRYGLANDSAKLNAVLKSSDLIGLRPLEITWMHVGRVVGQFVAIECKAPGWNPGKKLDEREQGQKAFLDLVQANGGHALFTTNGGVE